VWRVFVAIDLRESLMFPPPLPPFVPPQFGIKLVTESWERSAALRLRRHVFCDEQRLFTEDDRDEFDVTASPIVAVDYIMGMSHRVVGTVRIHEASPGLWYGSRLAIDCEYRAVYGLGSGLVYRAVTTAHARGAHTFLANVQQQNASFFQRLGWEPLAEALLYGRPHLLMRADLARYPAAADEAATALISARRAS
jgi:putative N-acetyltransferase (TIGR04045 family)